MGLLKIIGDNSAFARPSAMSGSTVLAGTKTATILCGKSAAKASLAAVKRAYDCSSMAAQALSPRLDIILANDGAESALYVEQKIKTLAKMGFRTRLHKINEQTRRLSFIESLLQRLNRDDDCDGILLQSPVQGCPSHLLAEQISPQKDVDGLHPRTLGLLASRHPCCSFVSPQLSAPLLPCTPLGIMRLLSFYNLQAMDGKRVVILGRSEIAGMPMALLCNQANATVTICHSKTLNLQEITRHADILISAVGKPGFLRGECVKRGAIVIDVGISRSAAAKPRVCGDVDFDSTSQIASAITPVPGGVGPMTVAMLVENLWKAFQQQKSSR